MRRAFFAVTALLTVVGCTGPGTAPDSPSPPVPTSGVSGAEISPASPSSPPAIQLVEEEQADLHLWVSNQSFKDDPIFLTVSIDGTVIVAQPFEVKSQHNWILFPVKIPPGRHVVNAVSETGAKMRERFTLPETGRRYAAIDYWNYSDGDGRHITWLIQSDPMAFA